MSRTVVLATASFLVGTALSIGDFRYPVLGNLFLLGGVLLYVFAALKTKRAARWFGHRVPERVRRFLAWSEVSVWPEWFSLGNGQWITVTPIQVLNQSDETLYSVYVELLPVGVGVGPRHIEIKPVEASTGFLEAGPYQITGDFLLDAIDDTRRREFLLIRLYELSPGQRRQILVRGTQGAFGRCGARIVSFAHEPDRLVQQGPDKAALQFRAPANMRIRGVAPLFRPK